jgi:hypothetical protein
MRSGVKTLSEKDFQQQVLDLTRLSGWLCYHTHDSWRSAPGFPDLVMVRPPRLLFVELNSEQGRLRLEQATWLEVLAGCEDAPEVHLWRPADFEDIQATLKREAA